MMSQHVRSSTPSMQLYRHWWLVAAGAAILLLVGGGGLHAAGFSNVHGWLLVAGTVAVFELWFLRTRLSSNYRPGEATVLLPELGAGTMLTVLRGLAIAGVAGFLAAPRPEGLLAAVPAVLYLGAIIADFFDGYVARVTDRTTRLGEQLDIEFDGLSLLIATLVAVRYGQLPVWYLPVGVPRYLFVFGVWWRSRHNRPCYPLPPSATRRMLAGAQMAFAAVVLWPVFSQPATTVAGLMVGIPFLAGFLRDWLVVSGRVDPGAHTYQTVEAYVGLLLHAWIPVVLRAAVVVVTAVWLLPTLSESLFRVAPVMNAGYELTLVAVVFGSLTIAATVMLGLGAAGRLAAAVLLVPVCVSVVAFEFQPYHALLLVGTISIVLFGTGTLSAWQPEERLLHRRAGA